MPVTTKAILNNRPNADNSWSVFIRITKDRRKIMHNAGVRINRKHWNENGSYESRNWVRTSLQNSEQQNVTIKKIIDKVTLLTSEDPDILLSHLQVKLSGKDQGDFISFWEDHMQVRNERLSPTSKDKYLSQLNKFKEFAGKKPVPFSALTYDLITKYEAWMLSKGRAPSTCSKAMGFLRTIIIEAVKGGYLKYDKNPFLFFQIKKYKSNKVRLTPEEMAVFAEKKAGTPTMQVCVDVFVMQYLTAGARVSDVIQMKWEDIKEGRWEYTMGKTDRMKNIKLNPAALKILKKYGDKKTGFVFPFLSDEIVKAAGNKFHKKIQSITAQINYNLKDFASLHEIKKNVHSHIARHSFADNARKASGNIYAISKALGHSKIATTENYLASLDDGAVDGLIDLVC